MHFQKSFHRANKQLDDTGQSLLSWGFSVFISYSKHPIACLNRYHYINYHQKQKIKLPSWIGSFIITYSLI